MMKAIRILMFFFCFRERNMSSMQKYSRSRERLTSRYPASGIEESSARSRSSAGSPWRLFQVVDKVKNLSNTVLLLLMLMAVYSHYMVNDKFERIAPALVFFFMLTGRLVIDWQLRREDAQSVTANGVDDKAKKQD
ncbi:uncharacterized protein LOC112466500 isoform X1 [Temnothorax curvispinosus]|uniref:Uncharacterized protein LOC112466500 isoform X1 n=1 Tax=Temnothorax curvispinosus TaxID=300111 RepID=A0A6J1RC80_9HYME|nr:uncharacterized protein LOC112466500 isoform X1 [Temnothorax curvispinosus]